MPDSTPEPPHLSLAQRGIRGAAWSYGGAGVVIVAQLLYTALTARLISPAEFGAYASAQALLALVGYFTLGTVGNAVIRHPTLDRHVVGTALLITGAAGAAVSVLVVAIAGFWAELWRSPDATDLIRLLAPQALLGGLAIVPMSLLRRDLLYRSATLIETSATLIGFAIGAILAFELRNAEALVLAQVATTGALFVLGIAVTRSRLAIVFSRVHARTLFSFSSQVALQNLSAYVNNTLPSLVVSRTLGQTSLGFFSRASLLVGLPQTFLVQGVQKTLYPIFPRFRSDEAECRRMLVDVTSVTTTLVWPLFALLAGLAPLVVDLLLGAQWDPAVSLVAPLCVYAAANFSYSILASFAESVGYLRQIWLLQALWGITLVGGLALAVQLDAGARGIVVVAAAIQVALHVVQIGLLARVRMVDAPAILRAELVAVVLAGIWYAAAVGTSEAVSDVGVFGQVVLGSALVALLTISTWLALPHLPAGRAFARRGIRIPLRTRSQPS